MKDCNALYPTLQISPCKTAGWTDNGQPAGRTNRTDYIDRYTSHMDQYDLHRKGEVCLVCLFVGSLTSQKHAGVSQGRFCSDIFTCCHTEIEVEDQTFYLTQPQYTDTGPSYHHFTLITSKCFCDALIFIEVKTNTKKPQTKETTYRPSSQPRTTCNYRKHLQKSEHL